jgi:hypothetical protein
MDISYMFRKRNSLQIAEELGRAGLEHPASVSFSARERLEMKPYCFCFLENTC